MNPNSNTAWNALEREHAEQNARWEHIEQAIRSVGPDVRFLIPARMLEEIEETCISPLVPQVTTAVGAIRA